MLFKTPARINAEDMLIDADEINEGIRANRIKFFNNHNIDPSRLVNFASIHGANIETVTRDSILGSGALDAESRIPNTDGLITNIKNSYLMVTGADCFPVMFWDNKKGVIATVHAGWRGIIKEIVPETILKLRNSFNSDPSDINAWIGPGIKSCHYSVDKERAELFSKNYKQHIIERDSQIYLDLAGIIALQLTKAGIKPEKITMHPDCTFCEKDKYFSHRRDKSEPIKANAFIIHLK